MDILITFCNTSEIPGFQNLGILDSETLEFNIIDLPKEIPHTGMVGMAASSKYIFIGLQHSSGGKDSYESPPGLLVIDKLNFNLLHWYKFRLAKDLHSFLLLNDERTLFVASTGTDEVIELELNEYHVLSEKVYIHLGTGERMDNHHVNSICSFRNEIYISAFGKKDEGGDWNTARNGFVMNLTHGNKIVENLEHPHSVSVIEGQLAFCESRKKSLRFADNNNLVPLPGYSRGLCSIGEKIYVATSAQRKKSKSTGKQVNSVESRSAGCTINVISNFNLQVERVIDLNEYGFEIYDLMVVEKTDKWPVSKPDNYREIYEQSWFHRAENVLEIIQNAIPKKETFLLVDENMLEIRNNIFPDHIYFPFLEKDGVSFGPPPDDETALKELIRMQENKGASYIAFAWPSFWWFEVYPEFILYLRNNAVSVLESEDLIVFKLP